MHVENSVITVEKYEMQQFPSANTEMVIYE